MIFILTFIKIFGTNNTLIGVCVYVGLAMFPYCDMGMKRPTMLLSITLAYIGSIILAQINTISPFVALPLNLVYVFVMTLLTSEPPYLKMNIIMLLPFLFTQSVPVNTNGFKIRLIASIVGVVIIAVVTLWKWKKNDLGNKDCRGIREQFKVGMKYSTMAIRLSLGISFGLLLSALIGSKKPLWITIVVLSLTQFNSDEMISRIKHRIIGTILGSMFFIITFNYILPMEYGMAVVFLFGFIGCFFDDYKTKQFINTVSAINASMIIFSTDQAVLGRFIGLAIGICIVLVLYFIEKIIINTFRKEPNGQN